ncbi:GntR family transcriptional regulator [Alsobacter sp. R-9]
MPNTVLLQSDVLEPLSDRKTLVEQVVDRIVEAAASGTFLPGDRVVEAEVARRLQVSRVPVREALRLLESQGIVENMPYRGMRLMDVSVARLEKVLKVRLVLEQLAAEEARVAAQKNPAILAPLTQTRDLMVEAARRGDRFELARLDTVFHRQLCGLTGNEVLLRTWEPLSLQLTIIFGLSAMQKDLGPIADEHTDIIDALRGKPSRAVASLMREHIVDYTRALDHEGFIERLRLSGTTV